MSAFNPAELMRLVDAVNAKGHGGNNVIEVAEYIQYVTSNRDAIVAAVQPRTVTTVDELVALPVGSVVRERGRSGYTYEKFAEDYWHGAGKPLLPREASIDLPATVLWLPEEGA